MTFQKPPDGGWGWVIILASFFIQFLCYGSPLSVGVLYVEWLDVFDEGKGKTAWVGSLAAGVGLLASPLCSASVSTFGARPVTIFSSFLVAGGLILSSFASNIYFLYFSYGFMVGCGCGLLYTATVTVTCQYFEKRRGLALGIVSTGSSVGTFIYASLQKELISIYGIDGCLLIIGALALNILACGILMRPLPQKPEDEVEKTCLENVPDAYLIYHEKDQKKEENMGMLEIRKSHASNGDCCSQENPHQSWFFDWTESYDIAFYFCGICVILGALGLLIVALPFWKNCKTKTMEPSPKSYSYKVASAV
ncbi:monocarboxylate transporter 9 isoform X2 [Rhinoderma darwinii]|uniref:monocarboxylate transporter 9 isoform X2 n=1 Tax=Rhinoderma darwinii TaxID=43563 RepID=UPI003F673536